MWYSLKLEDIGPAFEKHPNFPERVNTEFVQVVDATHLKMRVWERGSGATLACGTGACAVAAAAVLDRPLSARRAHFSTAAGRHAGGVCTAGRHRAFDRRRRSNI